MAGPVSPTFSEWSALRAGKIARCLDLRINRPGKFTEVAFVQRRLGMHQKGGMRGIQVVFDHDLLLRIVVVEG